MANGKALGLSLKLRPESQQRDSERKKKNLDSPSPKPSTILLYISFLIRSDNLVLLILDHDARDPREVSRNRAK